jgi:hypothetical protein
MFPQPLVSNDKSAGVRYSGVCQQLLISGRRSRCRGAAGPADGDRMVFYSLPLNGAIELCSLPPAARACFKKWPWHLSSHRAGVKTPGYYGTFRHD